MTPAAPIKGPRIPMTASSRQGARNGNFRHGFRGHRTIDIVIQTAWGDPGCPQQRKCRLCALRSPVGDDGSVAPEVTLDLPEDDDGSRTTLALARALELAQ